CAHTCWPKVSRDSSCRSDWNSATTCPGRPAARCRSHPCEKSSGMDDFRSWIRSELAARLAPRRDGARRSVLGAGNDDLEAGRRYLGALAGSGLAVPMWPREYGGLGATPEDLGVVRAELAAFDVPDLY